MSDMLQLVNMGNSQCATLRVIHCLSVANLDDKLKHVGHLFRVVSWIVFDFPSYVTDRQVKKLRLGHHAISTSQLALYVDGRIY
ncbi:MAG: hypothetical protein ACREBG_06900 [Pyrinomonadaceae bacterium]